MQDGLVTAMGVAARGGEPLEARDEVELLAGRGIRGDRYAEATGTFSRLPDPKQQLTLIAAEDLAEARAETGLDFGELDSRRNLVVSGMTRPLDRNLGMRFHAGEAIIEIVSPCPPCGWLDRCGPKGLHEALKNRGGIYAVVVEGGRLSVGDTLRPVEGSKPRRLP